IFAGDFTFEGGRRAAKNLVKHIENITAVVAANDETALGLMWELEQKGYQVPDDISVTGIGNIPASRYSYPPLTTVSLPLSTLGEDIGHFLVNKLQGEKGLADIINPEVELVERESVKGL
ncbi:MAG: substrate-binding domain-containing protein, partial [bacterium]